MLFMSGEQGKKKGPVVAGTEWTNEVFTPWLKERGKGARDALAGLVQGLQRLAYLEAHKRPWAKLEPVASQPSTAQSKQEGGLTGAAETATVRVERRGCVDKVARGCAITVGTAAIVFGSLACYGAYDLVEKLIK